MSAEKPEALPLRAPAPADVQMSFGRDGQTLVLDARWRAVLLTLAIGAGLLLPKIGYLVPSFFSGDDYLLVSERSLDRVLGFVITQGRFGQGALYYLLDAIGARPAHAPGALNLAAAALLAIAALAFIRTVRSDTPAVASVLFGVLCFSHPYLAELWTFRIGPFFFAFSAAVGAWGLVARKNVWGIGLVVLALSVYQTVLGLFFVVAFWAVFVDLIRLARGEDPLEALWPRWRDLALRLGLGLALYFLLNKLVLAVAEATPNPRARLLSLDMLPERLVAVGQTFRRIFWSESVLGRPALHVLLLAVLAVALVGGVWVIARGAPRRRGLQVVLPVLVVSAAAFSILGVLVPLAGWYPAARTLCAAGPFWAGAFVAAHTIVRRPGARTALLTLAGIVAFAQSAIGSHLESDQRRLNSRDLLVAARIVTRLEAHPRFGEAKRVILINPRHRYRDLRTAAHNLNLSALAVRWAYSRLLLEASGVSLGEATVADREAGQAYCATAERWPAPAAVTVERDLAIVCF